MCFGVHVRVPTVMVVVLAGFAPPATAAVTVKSFHGAGVVIPTLATRTAHATCPAGWRDEGAEIDVAPPIDVTARRSGPTVTLSLRNPLKLPTPAPDDPTLFWLFGRAGVVCEHGPAAAVRTRQVRASVSIGSKQNGGAFARCPAGWVVLSGTSTGALQVFASERIDGRTWVVGMHNPGLKAATGGASAVCVRGVSVPVVAG